MKIVIATRNEHKLDEIDKILNAPDLSIVSLENYPDMPEVIEDGNSFDANALKKARAVAAHTKEVTLADDSGLEVDFLNGKPGIFSSRFAGENASDTENNIKLLHLLKGVSKEKRTASFVCSIAIIDTTGKYYMSRGRCDGYIGESARGEDGFGYDPLFVVKGYEKTLAELSSEVKNSISHRHNALMEAKIYVKKIQNRA